MLCDAATRRARAGKRRWRCYLRPTTLEQADGRAARAQLAACRGSSGFYRNGQKGYIIIYILGV